MPKNFIGDEKNNPFGNQLGQIINKANKIARRKFVEVCDVPIRTCDAIRQRPDDFEFFRYKKQDVYFLKKPDQTIHFYQ